MGQFFVFYNRDDVVMLIWRNGASCQVIGPAKPTWREDHSYDELAEMGETVTVDEAARIVHGWGAELPSPASA
jgi:hypothetical protein